MKNAGEVNIPNRLTVIVPRAEGVESHVYNEIHATTCKYLDRIRQNESLTTFIGRRDVPDSMVLEIGYTDHVAGEAISREILKKVSRSCSKYGIETIQTTSLQDRSKKASERPFKRLSTADMVMASDKTSWRIWQALRGMGAVPQGHVAGPIRWQAVFFIGPAASGKSFVRNMRYMRHLDFKVVDPDEIKLTHPDYDPEAPFKVHAWSKAKSDAEFKETVEDGTGQPLIVDGTGRNVDGIVKKMRMAEKNGYMTYIVYVYVPFEVSIFRNRNRVRFVPEDIIMEQSAKIKKNFMILKRLADKSKVIPAYERSDLTKAKRDVEAYPAPQYVRPPRPGDPSYGVTSIAASRR